MSTKAAGQAAYEHAHGQVWDAVRGLHAAYQVDTANDLNFIVPTWDQLPADLRVAFIVHALDPLAEISKALISVSEVATQ